MAVNRFPPIVTFIIHVNGLHISHGVTSLNGNNSLVYQLPSPIPLQGGDIVKVYVALGNSVEPNDTSQGQSASTSQGQSASTSQGQSAPTPQGQSASTSSKTATSHGSEQVAVPKNVANHTTILSIMELLIIPVPPTHHTNNNNQ